MQTRLTPRLFQLEPLLAKGVELPGPETVTETAADQPAIEDGALFLCLILARDTVSGSW